MGFMATFLKDILKPGKYRLPNGRVVEYTADDTRHLAQRMSDMVRAGLKIPTAWNHQPVVPVTDEEWLAQRVKNVIGHAQGSRLDGSTVSALVDVDEGDAKQVAKAKYVSPEIRNNWIDGTGRLWPGLSITHLAVTGNPVNPHQSPFVKVSDVQLSGDVVRLSLDDLLEGTVMADEKDGKNGGKKGGPEEPEGGDFNALVEALRDSGMTIPDEVNDIPGLIIAVKAAGGTEGYDPTTIGDEPTITETAPVMMSLDPQRNPLAKQLLDAKRGELERRALALVASGKVTKPTADKLAGEIKEARLSLDKRGALATSPVLSKLEAYEALEGRSFKRPVRMSSDAVAEVPYPHEAEQSADEQEARAEAKKTAEKYSTIRGGK